MLIFTGYIRFHCSKNSILNLLLTFSILLSSSFALIIQPGQSPGPVLKQESFNVYADHAIPKRGSIVPVLTLDRLDKASSEETTLTQRIKNTAESLQNRMIRRIVCEPYGTLKKHIHHFLAVYSVFCTGTGLLSLCSRTILYIHNKDGSKPF